MIIRKCLRPVTLVCGLLLSATALQASASDRFEAVDVFGLEYVNNPRIAADGGRIVYERRSNDIMTDTTRSSIWIIDSDGSNHRPLITGAGDYSAAVWSPDGTRLAYVAREDGAASLRVRWMDTGESGPVLKIDRGAGGFVWSPDGKYFAFTMSVPAKPEPMVKPPAKPTGANWAEPPKVIESVIYRFDGRGFLEPAYTHVFVVPADGGTPRQLTEGDFNHQGPLVWTADGSEILLTTNHDPDWQYQRVERDIFAISVDSGALRQITSLSGGESNPILSPSGDQIAYVRDTGEAVAYRTRTLNLIDLEGGNERVLTGDLDRSVANIAWADNGASLYFTYANHGQIRVANVDLSGDIKTVAEGLGGTTLGRPYSSGTYSVSRDGTIAFTAGRSDRPADLGVVRGGTSRVLTTLNEDLLGHKKLGEVHEITYASSFDGEQIQGWYVTPPDFDPSKKYPLILELHGGPHSSYGPHFSAEIQRYAAEGYVVFYDNYRGSTSYGERFALLLQYKYSSPEDFADNMSGVDAMIERGFIDPDALYITGGSAGGIATAYAVGLTSRFKAAVAAKPIINWLSKTLTGDIYTSQIYHQFPGMPWDEFEHYWQRSPLSLVGNVTTPTMLITGEQDYRTPISETEQFYQALKLRRIDTAMVRIPGSGHGIAGKPSRLIAKVEHILAWFARYGKEEAVVSD